MTTVLSGLLVLVSATQAHAVTMCNISGWSIAAAPAGLAAHKSPDPSSPILGRIPPFIETDMLASAFLLSANGEGIPKDSDASVYDSIVETVGQTYKWAPDDIAVSLNKRLATSNCLFFRAANQTKPDAGTVDYALLPDGSLVGGADGTDAAAKVLRTCGETAPVGWWVDAVTSFTGKASGRVVTKEDKLSINMIKAAGGEFSEPWLDREGISTIVTFYVIQRMIEPAFVKAVLSDQGWLDVKVTPLK